MINFDKTLSMEIEIAIADDNHAFRKQLKRLLEYTGKFKVPIEAANGAELISKFALNQTDIVLMDVKMPTMDGIIATQLISEQYKDVKVIAVSFYDDVISVIKMIRSGARSFISKDNIEDLELAIRSVLADGYFFPQSIGKVIQTFFNSNSNLELEKTTSITDFEIELLTLLSQGLSSTEIANIINRSPRTIEGYRSHLYEKLNVKNKEQLLIKAAKMSLI